MKSEKDVFNQYLKENGIRYSEQRNYVLEVFLETESHVTVADIFELVRKKYPTVGFATVYRAMKVICNAELAEEVDFGDGVMRYEHKYGHTHHDHLICIECGRLIEVTEPEIEKLQDKLASKHGFMPFRHRMQIFGQCSECR